MKNTFSVVIVTGIALIAGAYLYRSHVLQKEHQKHGLIAAAKLSKQVGDLVARSGALTDWRERVGGTDWQEDGYSIELQQNLGTGSGKPILMEGTVADIFQRGKRSFIAANDIGLGPVWLIVECDTNQANELTRARPRHPRTAFIVQVSTVEKDRLKLESSSERDEDGDSVNVTDIARGSDEFFVYGRCLSFLVEGGDN